MTHARRRDDDDAGTAVMNPPTQFQVVTVEGNGWIEPTQLPEEIGPGEQERTRDGKDVADTVVLLLIELPGLDAEIDFAESIDTEANRLEYPWVIPFDQLGPDDAGVRAVDLLDEQSHGVALGGDIVVAEQEEASVPLDEPEDLVARRAEAQVCSDVSNEGFRHAHADARAQLFVVRREEEQVPEVRVVLFGQRIERLVEPITRFVYDHDGHDGWRLLSFRFHDGARLAGPSRTRRSCWNDADADAALALEVPGSLSPMAQWHSVDLTNFDLAPAAETVLDVSTSAVKRAVDVAKDVTYVGVGLGLLTYQRAQVRRREFERALRN